MLFVWSNFKASLYLAQCLAPLHAESRWTTWTPRPCACHGSLLCSRGSTDRSVAIRWCIHGWTTGSHAGSPPSWTWNCQRRRYEFCTHTLHTVHDPDQLLLTVLVLCVKLNESADVQYLKHGNIESITNMIIICCTVMHFKSLIDGFIPQNRPKESSYIYCAL